MHVCKIHVAFLLSLRFGLSYCYRILLNFQNFTHSGLELNWLNSQMIYFWFVIIID